MPDEPENLTLTLLREIRDDVRDVKDRLETLETQMGGVGGMLTLIYGKQLDHEERIEKLETKRE